MPLCAPAIVQREGTATFPYNLFPCLIFDLHPLNCLIYLNFFEIQNGTNDRQSKVLTEKCHAKTLFSGTMTQNNRTVTFCHRRLPPKLQLKNHITRENASTRNSYLAEKVFSNWQSATRIINICYKILAFSYFCYRQ